MRKTLCPWLLGAAAVLLGCLSGCAPPPPSEDALLYYLSNARLHGNVRRVWPAGQTYLNGIMKYDVALQRQLAELSQQLTPESLWLRADPRWQDAGALDKHVADLHKLIDQPETAGADPNKPEDLDKLSRKQLLAALAAAIKQVPDGLPFRSEAGKVDFAIRVGNALLIDGVTLRDYVKTLEADAQQRLDLYQQVLAGAADLDPARPGLHVKDAARQTQLDEAYEKLRAALDQRQQTFLALAASRLPRTEDLLRGIDKREERADYELYSNERKDFRDRLTAWMKTLRTQCEQAQADLDKATKSLEQARGDDKPKQERNVAFCKEVLAVRQARRDALEPRINKILEQTDAMARQPAASRGD